MSTKEDLLNQWLTQYTSRQSSGESTELPSLKRNASPAAPHSASTAPHTHSKPSFQGRLADHLAKQQARNIAQSSEKLSSPDVPWTVDDIQTKAVVAMSLILAENLAQFAKTTLSETHLIRARDAILKDLSPKDAVKIEVEAYEMLSWFAASLNPEWKPQSPETPQNFVGQSQDDILTFIIQDAIANPRDLSMHYYTGSRGEFSDRTITPIEITAEKYLIAFCHLRNEERVFRLSRIVRLAQLPNENDASPILCYPIPEDTKLPPLPEPPQQSPKLNTLPAKNKSKTSSSKSKNITHKSSSSEKSKNISHKTKQSQENPKERSLFDLPQKKKKSPIQSMLPGFEDDL